MGWSRSPAERDPQRSGDSSAGRGCAGAAVPIGEGRWGTGRAQGSEEERSGEQSRGQLCRKRLEAPSGFLAKTEQKSLCGTDPGRDGKEAATTEEKEGCGCIVLANLKA